MKKTLLIIFLFNLTLLLQAQVSKTVNVAAGGLYSALTITERNTITNLTITGTIDASDFKTMRDNMPLLILIDISGTTITGYTGKLGTGTNTIKDIVYQANMIPQKALKECTKLTSINLPSSATAIGDTAFYHCSGLTSLTIPSNILTIGTRAFYNCSGLASITISSSLNSIGEYAFQYCAKLTSITIPSSVNSIGVGTFANSGLTSITIPILIPTIKAKTFIGCTELISISFLSELTSIEENAFIGCAKLASVTIPKTVKSIGNSAFQYCAKLTSITIPSSVNSIGSFAFASCTGLTSIYANSVIPITLYSEDVFYVNTNTCILYVPKNSINAYRVAFVWKNFMNVEGITTGINLNNSNEISIYPNPTTDGFIVNGITDDSMLRISDINGMLKLTKQIENNEFVSLQAFSEGVYLIRVTSAGVTIDEKVIKK